MPKPDIQKLEERVLTLMGEFRRLKEENEKLSFQLEKLNREKESFETEYNLNKGNKDRLFQLENINRENEKDRKAIRSRVQAIIKNLDSFDPA